MSVCELLVCVVCGSQSSKVSRPPSRETWTYTSWSVAVVKVFYTHHTHIKAKGNMSSPCLEILSSFSSFYSACFCTFTGDRYKDPLSSFLSQIHTQYTIMSAGLLSHFSCSFHSLLLSSHFSLSFSHLISSIWLPLQSPWAWGPQKGIQAGFLLSALPIIVRLTISLSFFLC